MADATAMLPEGGEIAVITDLANRALAGIDPTGLPAGVQLHIVPVAGGGDNRAITRLSLRPGMASLNQTVELGVQVANHAATPADITVEILTNSAREQRTVHIEARSVARLTSPLRFTTAGDQSVHVALINNEGDALTEDDELDGVIPVRDGIAVTVVGDGDQGPRGALRPIVAALKASGLNYRVISSAQAAHDPLASEVLISAGATAETGFSTMAAAFLDRGGCWLQIIDGPGDIALARAISDNHMPIVLGEEFSAKSREISAFTVVQARLEHPLLSGFFGREVLLGQVEAYRIVLGTPADHSQVLLAFEDGTPALAELAVGRGRWWQLNCSPAEVRSNLAALDLMPLFVERLSAAVIPELAASLSIDCGNAIPAPRGIVHLQRGAVLINDSRALLPWPGLYRDATGGLIAAGIPEAESDLRPVAAGVITALGVRVDENGGDSDHGTPLWPWLLLAGTIALMLESIVARPAPRGPA